MRTGYGSIGVFGVIAVIAVVAFGCGRDEPGCRSSADCSGYGVCSNEGECVGVTEVENGGSGAGNNAADAGDASTDRGCGEMLAYFDGDGDGRGRGTREQAEEAVTVFYCPGDDPPAGYVWTGYDCDDTDPSAYRLFPRDADGDGFGVKDEDLSICAGEERPAGYTWYRTDCDDGDPLVNPDAIDYWGDGLDPNCDGLDIPQDCGPEVAGVCRSCEEKLPATPEVVDVDTACGGLPDLFVVEPVDCIYRCNATYHMRIGNSGAALFEGDITLTVGYLSRVAEQREFSEFGVYTITVKLGSGELSVPFSLPDREGFLEVSVDTGGLADCDASNNRLEFLANRYECWL